MRTPPNNRALRDIAVRLAALTGYEPNDILAESGSGARSSDWRLSVGPHKFTVEWKRAGGAAQIAAAIDRARRNADQVEGALPLIAVPFMGETGRQRCAEADVAWLDLSGNAHIFVPGLRVMVEGKPNLFKRPGRPSSAFAPKSARVARWLLMNPDEPFSQRDISRATAVDEGHTSRIVSKLEQDGLITRAESGAILPRDPDLLLDAWREAYDFGKHEILKGHVAARSGEELLRRLAASLNSSSTDYAATGLAGAWLIDRFASFRVTTLYLPEPPSSALLESVSFREEERGANVWLVVPNDEGVFQGYRELEGIRCAHPVQVYLDLGAHPERSTEAAQHLRQTGLRWRTDV